MSKILKRFILLGDKAPIATRIPSEFYSYVGSSIDWNFVSQPQTNTCLQKPCIISAGKVLGGSTVRHESFFFYFFLPQLNDY